MKSQQHKIRDSIVGMMAAYSRGENMMAWARKNADEGDLNNIASTLIAYDLQAGTYVASARANPVFNNKWCAQLAELISPYISSGDRILEVGVGEATTLAGTIRRLKQSEISSFGLDISWSRLKVGTEWLLENSINSKLFVGDLFHIPLADNSIDVVYTSHSLEPNGGREIEAVAELIRVAKKTVILIEPCYELASEEAQIRMQMHGYVKGLKTTAEELGATIVQYGLLDVCGNILNPSGVLILLKNSCPPQIESSTGIRWQCPLTGTAMVDQGDVFRADQVGLVYPVMRGIPLLRGQHSVVASHL